MLRDEENPSFRRLIGGYGMVRWPTRGRARSRRLALLLALFLPAAAVSCTGGAEGSRPAPGELTVGIGEPATLIPGDLRDRAGRLVASALWTGLAELDPDGRPVPAVAESITSTDRRVWTVRIRPGWRFHDGSPVTARSFAGSWQAVLAERWRGAGLLTDVLRVSGAAAAVGRRGAPVPGIAVPGPMTLRVTLDGPFSQFPLALTAPALLPLPDAVLASRDWTGFAARPVGNGPFRLAAARDPGGGMRAVRDPGYPARPGGRRARAEAIEFRVYPGPAEQYRDAGKGSLDLATDVPPERHDSLGRLFGDRHLAVPEPEITYLGFPLWDPRYRDPAVRHAVSLALDRESLAAVGLEHRATAATSLLPPAAGPGRRSDPCRGCRHDGEAARALLTQAGGLRGQVTVWHEAGAGPQAAARALAAQLRSVLGIAVAPRAAPPGGYPRALARRQVDGPFLLTVPLPYAGAGGLLGPAGPGGPVELTGYRDPELPALRAEAAAAPSPDAADRRYRLVEGLLLRDLPLAPLWSPHAHLAWSERVSGVVPEPYAGVRLDLIQPAR